MEIEQVGEEHMAKDYLNVVERALMMGISDKVNTETSSENVYVFGEFPETEDLKFPCIIVQLLSSGFEEQMVGKNITFGESSVAGTGEVYGSQYMIHIIIDKETSITPDGSTPYKQRRALNWLMLNIANAVADIDWTLYEEEELEILERHLVQWQDIGFLDQFKWYGASAIFQINFKNYRT